MSSPTSILQRRLRAGAGLVHGFRRDQRGSMSILGATFIALLLGMGSVALKVGDSYVGKLRDFRSADIVAHALSQSLAKSPGQTGTAPAPPGGLPDMLGEMNGSHLGTPRIFFRDGHTVFQFPCGIEIVV